jgi:hypothetical protein
MTKGLPMLDQLVQILIACNLLIGLTAAAYAFGVFDGGDRL